MSEHKEPIPSRLYNVSVGGHVAGTEDIIDDKSGLTINELIGDKDYDSANFGGMGKVTLPKNIQNIEGTNVNVLTQDMFYTGEDNNRVPNANTIFVVKYDYVIGENITIPDNCIIDYSGGKIITDSNNYKLIGSVVINNMPESIFSDMNCSKLDIINIQHLSNKDFMDTKPTTSTIRLQFINAVEHIKSSSKLYNISNLNKLYTINTFNFASGNAMSIRFVFFNKDRSYISQTSYISNFYEVDVPDEAVYVQILFSGQSFWLNYTFEEVIDKTYANFTENSYINIDIGSLRDYTTQLSTFSNDYISVDLTDRSLSEIISDSAFNNYGKYYRYNTSNVITSACIPYQVLKFFDYIEINPNENKTYIHFLKQKPTENEEDVIYSDTYQGPYPVFGKSNSGTITLPIPSDTKYILISMKYHSNEELTTIIDGTPSSVYLRKAKNLGVDCNIITGENILDYNNFRSLSKNLNRTSLNFMTWNVGNFGNGDYKTHIDENNYSAKKTSFNRFLAKYNSYNLLFNEFNPVFAKVNGTNKSGWECAASNNYCIRKVMPRFTLYDNLAFSSLLSLAGWKFGRLSSYDGRLKSNGDRYNPIAYCIYQYSLGNGIMAVIHVHLGTRMTDDTIAAVTEELRKLGADYATCIILGDFNISDRTKLSVLTNVGYSIGNDLDLDNGNVRPTYPTSNTTLDWVLYKGNITLSNFKVCLDAVDYGYSDGDTSHMLSDHWPISFTVTTNTTPPKIANKGEMYFDQTLGKPIWFNGTDWVDATGTIVNS